MIFGIAVYSCLALVAGLQHCRTATSEDGDDAWKACYAGVLWLKSDGLRAHPDWYPNLSASWSTFEEIQFELYKKRECPLAPCPRVCGIPVSGDACQSAVNFAINEGIYSHPEWYPGLSSFSTRAEFHNHEYRAGVNCLAPLCPVACSTSTAGEACFGNVEWVMSEGILKNPEWYPMLNSSSTFEDVQSFLYQRGVNDGVCSSPPCTWTSTSMLDETITTTAATCADTDGWSNGHGYDCAAYASKWCLNGAAKTGSEWAMGKSFKYPENNCCACGKQTSAGTCQDTSVWNNLHGHNCASYASQWCQNGAAITGKEWALGESFNYPEKNCCVCGKETKVGICGDASDWSNGYGHNCASYASLWCHNGVARIGKEWTLGAKYNHPEQNCCACGKEGTPIATSTTTISPTTAAEPKASSTTSLINASPLDREEFVQKAFGAVHPGEELGLYVVGDSSVSWMTWPDQLHLMLRSLGYSLRRENHKLANINRPYLDRVPKCDDSAEFLALETPRISKVGWNSWGFAYEDTADCSPTADRFGFRTISGYQTRCSNGWGCNFGFMQTLVKPSEIAEEASRSDAVLLSNWVNDGKQQYADNYFCYNGITIDKVETTKISVSSVVKLIRAIHSKNPSVMVFVMAIYPDPIGYTKTYEATLPTVRAMNSAMKAGVEQEPNATFVDFTFPIGYDMFQPLALSEGHPNCRGDRVMATAALDALFDAGVLSKSFKLGDEQCLGSDNCSVLGPACCRRSALCRWLPGPGGATPGECVRYSAGRL